MLTGKDKMSERKNETDNLVIAFCQSPAVLKLPQSVA